MWWSEEHEQKIDELGAQNGQNALNMAKNADYAKMHKNCCVQKNIHVW